MKRELERGIAAELGLETEVFMRTRAQLAKVVAADPLGKVVENPSWYQVSFLAAKLPAKAARELENADVAPEQVVVLGREIYAWYPSGMQRTGLAQLLTERKLGVSATARNWNTVTKLLALALSRRRGRAGTWRRRGRRRLSQARVTGRRERRVPALGQRSLDSRLR